MTIPIVTITVLLTATFAHAADAVTLLPTQKGWVSRIQEAVQAIQSSHSHFEQTSADGHRAYGEVWLARPGKMRFAFDAPENLLIVANDGKLVYQDRELGQVTSLPLNETPLSLLLQDNVAFSGPVSITRYEDDGPRLHLTITQTGKSSEGSLTLDVQKTPLMLLGWSVLDAQGKTTRVALSQTETGIAAPRALFKLPQDSD